MIEVTVTPESERALLVRLDGAKAGAQKGLRAGINAGTIYLAGQIKRLVSGPLLQNRTGNLRRAIFSRMLSNDTGVVGVGAEAPYARFQNDGVNHPWVITAHGKALRFTIGGHSRQFGTYIKQYGGDVLFRKSVTHPGLKARHFMEAGLTNSAAQIREIISQRVNAAVKGQNVE